MTERPSPFPLAVYRAQRLLVAAALAAAGWALAALAPGEADAYDKHRTDLVSRAFDGGLPNGPSSNAVISHDERINRVVAFQSRASNIVRGDTNGHQDIFVVNRQRGWGRNGTPWYPGSTELVSRGRRGEPANGDSWGASVDGTPKTKPTCVAFVSDASNLVHGDTNGKPDAFVADLSSGRIQRVSVDSRRRQARGSTYEVAVNGTCTRVAFTSDARNLAMTRAPKSHWRKLRTTRPRSKTTQVYVRVISRDRRERDLRGVTYLASSYKRRAGNRSSFQPAFAISTAIIRSKLVFASRATNLSRGDRTRTSDVYMHEARRSKARFGKRRRLRTVLTPKVRLVSATSRRRAGNGASSRPSPTWNGRYVAFQTEATNLTKGERRGLTNIVRRDLSRRRNYLVSANEGEAGNRSSYKPNISNGGEFVAYESDATNFLASFNWQIRWRVGDRNGVRDIFLWTLKRRRAETQSQTYDGYPLGAPSTNPYLSTRGNYLLYDTEAIADVRYGSPSDRSHRQVYMYYLGPK